MVLHTRKHRSSAASAEVLSFNVEEVGFGLHPCPNTFHAKVASWKDETGCFVRSKELKMEDILKKQERAKQYRLVRTRRQSYLPRSWSSMKQLDFSLTQR